MKIKIESGLIRKDDRDYPELLKKIGKGAPKQIYYRTLNSHSDTTLRKTNFSESLSPFQQAEKHAHTYSSEKSFSSHKSTPFINLNIFSNCLAVVGSRKLTNYGKQTIERIVGELAIAGITIVSGFMYGADAEAHKTAVKVGGRTIAVMPCGINRISPEDQEELYNDIINNNGLIISEYEGDMAPVLWTYPRRNRIVAGLSKAVLIIEAGEKSGSLITANLAKKFGRKIFAVPGPITSSVSIGTNRLIKEGAEMVTDAKGILRYFRDKSSHSDLDKKTSYSDSMLQKTNFFESLSPTRALHEQHAHACDSKKLSSSHKKDTRDIEEQILDLLGREAVGMDEMSRKLEVSVSELSVKLSMMEMQGKIKLEGGRYYCEQ